MGTQTKERDPQCRGYAPTERRYSSFTTVIHTEPQHTQERVMPFMDAAKSNSLSNEFYLAGINQYHEKGW
jgi:hypothetical protein